MAAGEAIFLQDGRTIQAENTETIGGDPIRVSRPVEVIGLPHSKILSIHPIDLPMASPNSPPPAAVYRDLSQQITDQVRREIQNRSATSHLE